MKNQKRATSFSQCPPPIPDDTPVINDVQIQPDPPKAGSTLHVTGSATTKKDVTDDDFLGLGIFDIDFDHTFTLPDNIPDQYVLGLGIGPSQDPTETKACGQ
ncbi:7618_t:CDS:2, partial [Racocetra fulgida]